MCASACALTVKKRKDIMSFLGIILSIFSLVIYFFSNPFKDPLPIINGEITQWYALLPSSDMRISRWQEHFMAALPIIIIQRICGRIRQCCLLHMHLLSSLLQHVFICSLERISYMMKSLTVMQKSVTSFSLQACLLDTPGLSKHGRIAHGGGTQRSAVQS